MSHKHLSKVSVYIIFFCVCDFLKPFSKYLEEHFKRILAEILTVFYLDCQLLRHILQVDSMTKLPDILRVFSFGGALYHLVLPIIPGKLFC